MSRSDPLEELEAALFSAGRRERPHDDVRARALDAAITTAREHDDDAPADGARQTPTRSRRQVYALAIGLAATLGAMGVGIAHFRGRGEPVFAIGPEPSSQDKPAPPAPSSRQREKEPASAPSTEPAREKHGVPRVVSRGAHDGVTAPAEPKSVASLPEEIGALDRVRSALSAGNATAALRGLDDYEHVLHGTRLTAEAAVLRIDALARSGRAREASDLARRFVDGNPGSPLAERARTFILRNESSGVDAGGLR